MRAISTIALFLFFSTGVRLSNAAEAASAHAAGVRLNSIGYLPESKKLATVDGDAKEFVVRDIKADAEVIAGRLVPIQSALAKESPASVADFSALKHEGVYEIKIR